MAHAKFWAQIVTGDLFKEPQTGNNLDIHEQVGTWIKVVVYPYSRILLIKKNRLLIYTMILMNFQSIMVNKISQTQRVHPVQFHLYEILE